MTQTTEQERAQALAEKHGATSYRNRADTQNPAYGFTPIQLAALIADVEQAARRAPAVPETIEQRAKKLKGLQVLTGATAGVPEAIALARSRFVEAYGRSPLHDDLAYACLLIDSYGGAPAVPVPQGWKLVPVEPTREMLEGDARKVCVEGALVAAWRRMLAAAPQPPEEAPVQMPEPVAEVQSKFGTTCMFSSTTMRKGDNIYTDQKVLTILTQHGIKTK